MTWADLPLLLVLPVLALLSGVCAASETALFSLTYSDRQRLRHISPGASRAVEALLSQPRRLLLAILLITNAANVSYFVVSAILERRVGAAGLVGVLLNIGALVALVMIADLMPKLMARRMRVQFARILAGVLRATLSVVGPVCGFLEHWVIGPIVRLIRPDAQHRALDAEELGKVLELSAKSGEIGSDDQRMLEDVVGLGHVRVKDVMTPRVSLLWIDSSASLESIRAVIARARRERLPVFDGSLETPPRGFLNVRAFVHRLEAAPAGAAQSMWTENAIRAALEPAVYVPERARLDRAFELLSQKHETAGIVVDEFGAVVGIVAMSDLVKQLVAPVRQADLLRPGIGEGPVVRVSEQAWSVSGRLPVRALRELLGTSSPTAGAGTIAGLVVQRLGRFPAEGESVELGDVQARVTRTSGPAIERVELTLLSRRGGRR